MSKPSRIRKSILWLSLLLTVVATGLTQFFLWSPSENSAEQQLADLNDISFLDKSTKPTKTIKWDFMDYGPFFSSSLGGPKNPVAKGISIQLGATNEAAVCFDTELLRMRMGWTGGFLHLSRFRDGLQNEPRPVGKTIFQSLHLPGWLIESNATNQRSDSSTKNAGRYKGLFTYGKQTILSYTVGNSSVLESPSFTRSNGFPIFRRSFQIDHADAPLIMQLCNVAGAKRVFVQDLPVLLSNNPTNTTFTIAKVIGAPKGFAWDLSGAGAEGIRLKLPRFDRTNTFSVFICSGPKSEMMKAIASLPETVATENLEQLCHGGPSLWNQPVVTQGKLGTKKSAYQLDTLTLPDENPWRSWLRPSGFDFFPDGRAALCSLSGDVWIASGLDAKLDRLAWKRFATGLFQPLGLKIIRNEIYVMCRDAIIRLHDLNGDGEADYYESFNSDISNAGHFHEFCLDLQTDTEGNLYTFKGSNLGPAGTSQQGTLLKILPDGSKVEALANGFRAPNGLCLDSSNELFGTDNEGDWIPACKINHITTNKFYGFAGTSHSEKLPLGFEAPICWLPHVADNSSGAPIWAESERWGPFGKTLLHTSYGTCSLFAVMTETVNGTWQGGVVKFPLKFESGIMRGRFNPVDGQLYLCGLAGWQSSATKDGGFYRVRYTGVAANMPNGLRIHPDEIEIRFTDPLEIATATDPQNFSIEQWNYKWSQDYGSKDYSLKSPDLLGRDPVEVKAVRISADQKAIFLSVPKLKPVMQMKIEFNINAADGSAIHQEIYNTINAVPSADAVKK